MVLYRPPAKTEKTEIYSSHYVYYWIPQLARLHPSPASCSPAAVVAAPAAAALPAAPVVPRGAAGGEAAGRNSACLEQP